MKQEEDKENDFNTAKQGAIVDSGPNKTRITIRIDNDILDWFRARVHEQGGGNYQTLINKALSSYISLLGMKIKTSKKNIEMADFDDIELIKFDIENLKEEIKTIKLDQNRRFGKERIARIRKRLRPKVPH
jgi:uncharacterized protein (DUF4415 family)